MTMAPDAWAALMGTLTEVVRRYLRAQVAAGADAIQLFDSWVGDLAPADYAEFVQPYVRRILADCDRLLVAAALSRRAGQVRVTANDWFEVLSQLLVRDGHAELIGEADNPEPLAGALVCIGSTPVDSESLLVHARLVGVQRDGSELRALIELPEAFQ